MSGDNPQNQSNRWHTLGRVLHAAVSVSPVCRIGATGSTAAGNSSILRTNPQSLPTSDQVLISDASAAAARRIRIVLQGCLATRTCSNYADTQNVGVGRPCNSMLVMYFLLHACTPYMHAGH